MGGQDGEVANVVARLATGAHGVVSRRELLRRISTECTTPGRAAVPDGSALSELYAATDFRVLGAVNAQLQPRNLG